MCLKDYSTWALISYRIDTGYVTMETVPPYNGETGAWHECGGHLVWRQKLDADDARPVLLGEKVLLPGQADGLGATVDSHLGEDAADVKLDRVDADHQPLRDIGVRKSVDHQR